MRFCSWQSELEMKGRKKKEEGSVGLDGWGEWGNERRGRAEV